MENSVTGNSAKTGDASADKAAERAKSGVRIAQDSARDVGNVLANQIEDVRSEAGTVIHQGTKRIQSTSKQSLTAISEMAGQARDIASTASDSIVAYTKMSPVKALAIAAASGAVLYAISKLLRPSRD